LDEGLADTIVSRRVGAHRLIGVGAVGVAVRRNPGISRADGTAGRATTVIPRQKRYDPKLGGRPQPKIAIVTCMDPRLSDLEGILGLKTADMDVIRTGGPAVTDDVLGELVVSTRVLGSKEIMLLNHTGCGFTTFTDKELNEKVARETGDATPVPMRLFSFKDPEENTRAQIEKVRSHPWIAKDVPVRGFIFDVDTGRLREVKRG
jgi:carbonic anhydrase